METREKEIDIRLLVVSILKQWRWMLVCALICMVGFAVFQYVKDYRQYIQATSQGTTESIITLEELQDSLTADELSNVSTYVALYETLDDMRQERMDNTLYQIDPYYENVYQLTYVIQLPTIEADVEELDVAVIADHLADGTIMNQLANAYMYRVKSGELIQDIAQEVPDVSVRDLNSLITCSTSNGVVSIQIAYLEDMDIEAIVKTIKKDLTQYSKELQTLDVHEFLLLDESKGVLVDDALAERNYTYTNRSYSIQSQMNALENNFDDAEKEYIKIYLENRNQKPGEESLEDSVTIPASDDAVVTASMPRPSKKMAAIGFLVGILLVCGWRAATYILMGRLHSAEDISEYYQLPVYGVQTRVKGNSKKGLDRLISRLEHYNQQKLAPDSQKEIILSGIRLYCQQNELKEIAFSGTDFEHVDEEYLKELQTGLESSGIRVVMVKNIFYYPEALQEAADVSRIILFETLESSIETEIEHILMKANEYNIQVVGAVVFE